MKPKQLFLFSILCFITLVHPRDNDDTNDLELLVTDADLSAVAANLEDRLQDLHLFLEIPNLQNYCERIAQEVLKVRYPGFKDTIRFRFVKSNDANAYSLANGLIILCTGVLPFIADENELALLISHEIAHILLKHHRERRYELHRKSYELTRQQVISSYFIGSLALQSAEDQFQRAMSGFSRDYEFDADMEGLKSIVALGYDTQKGIHLFQTLKKVYDDDYTMTDTTLLTHPSFDSRIDQCKHYLKQENTSRPSVIIRTDSTAMILHKFIFPSVEDYLMQYNFDKADILLSIYEKYHASGFEYSYLKGRLYSLRNNNKDIDTALIFFRTAYSLNPSHPGVLMNIGKSHFCKADYDSARFYFEKHLSIASGDLDRPFIEYYLKECK